MWQGVQGKMTTDVVLAHKGTTGNEEKPNAVNQTFTCAIQYFPHAFLQSNLQVGYKATKVDMNFMYCRLDQC